MEKKEINNIDLAQSIDKIFQELKVLKETKKEVKTEKKEISNSDLAKSINEISKELKDLKETKKEVVETEKVEEINDNFKKSQEKNDTIFVNQMNMEPFNKLNDFIFKHEIKGESN